MPQALKSALIVIRSIVLRIHLQPAVHIIMESYCDLFFLCVSRTVFGVKVLRVVKLWHIVRVCCEIVAFSVHEYGYVFGVKVFLYKMLFFFSDSSICSVSVISVV
jgi:hypothetical protein